MQKSLFINGIFRTVLEEIVSAQNKDVSLICYLQPYSSRTIKLLADNPPSLAGPIRLYASTTETLGSICFTADVVAEIMIRAKGKCELCGSSAPFFRARDGSPYLEAHHWIPLADGGEDSVKNAGALCPNCHRELHFGKKQ